MLEWMNKQGVKSGSTYALQRMHRFYYHYIEGDHVLKVDVEPTFNGEDIFLKSTLAWEPPNEGEPIPADKLIEIEIRIGEALKFMGIRHKIQRT